uniref:SLC26A/SulP transporter domain-containing protein n=1 Tax=Electrophorus electricus TaxID=8005 RepID=A0AAY5F4P1_ELEEL
MRDLVKRRRLVYNIQREVMDELRVDEVADKSAAKTSLSDNIKESVRCSGPRVKSCFLSCVPLLSWMPRYPFRENIFADLVSGISVGIMHLPQGMAYALLAAVPPVFGLYSSFYPVLIYFIFGSSNHISVGTYSVMSVMIGGVTERLAPDSDFMILNNDTIDTINETINDTINDTFNDTILDTAIRDIERVKIAAAVTFLSGIFQLLLGLVQFGFVVTYLSEPLVRGYTTAASIHVIVSQLKYIFGINPHRYSGPLSLIYTMLEVCSLLDQTNIGTLVVSIVTIVGLILAKEVNSFLVQKLPVPIPVELLAIIIATLVSWQVDLKTVYGVQTVGEIPSGLQAPVMPEFSIMRSIIGDAFAMAVVGYGIDISLGRIFALKYGYKVDSNQELVALGLSNMIGGFFQCFAISCSMSRSMVQISTGGKSQVAGAVSAMVILFILLKIGELFQDLPKAVLAGIIYVNLHGMMKQFGDIPALWRKNKVDMLVWLMTLILTILLNPDLGLAASIAFSMFTVIFRTQLSGLEYYTTLYFANAELYTEHLYDKTGVDVPKLLSHKKKLEAKRQRKDKKEAQKAKKEAKKRLLPLFFRFTGIMAMLELMYSCQGVRVRPAMCWALILYFSFSCFSFLSLFPSPSLFLFSLFCLSACVIEILEKGDFFSDKLTKMILFSSVHDAVLHCQAKYSSKVRQNTPQTEPTSKSKSILHL